MTDVAAAPADSGKLALRPAYFIMAGFAFVAMFVAILGPSLWFLTWVHIMAGVLWTGIDLFLGFVIGPILRRLPFETRRTVIGQLIPKTMVLMPTLSIVTGTAGYFLAQRTGYLDLGYPEFWWVAAALGDPRRADRAGARHSHADQYPGLSGNAESKARQREGHALDENLCAGGRDPGRDAGRMIVIMARFGSGASSALRTARL